MALKSETRLGPYTILSPLGKGGMGEVYRATDTRLGRDVAIKVLPDNLSTDANAMKRFQTEAKALAALSHPNIVAIFDVGTDQGISFVVMELLQGETLRSRLTHSLPSWQKAVEIAIAVAEGLAAAHSKGVVHRDLKPENIFMTSDERVKILDFGLARLKPVGQEREFTGALTESIETQAGMLRGTVPYMSPEQARGDVIDARSDIFSFGCVLYEMTTGKRTFSGQTHTETLAAILKDAPLKPSELSANIPNELEDQILHCLEKNREQRFQSAQDLAFALKRLLTSQPSQASSPIYPSKMRGAKIPLVIAVLAAVFITFYLLYFQSSAKPIDSLAVLPFVNASVNPESEYLSDGITENLINHLSTVPNLRVMARTTVFTYKGKQVDPREVGRKLNVRAVLIGKLDLRGNDLVIQADLVNASDGTQIWGDRFPKKLSDILLVQEEIAREISDHLRIKLTGSQKKQVTRQYTKDTEAYQSYLKGRYYWNKRTPDDLKKALGFFEQATDKDPTYAPAYSGIADVYLTLYDYEILSAEDTNPKAKAAANKALEIDDSLAEGHTSLAHLYLHEWKWDDAEMEFRRAIELNPGYSVTYHWYSLCLTTLGRLEEAVQMMKRAQELDPLSSRINADLGMAYFAARKYDEAINQEGKTLELNPNSSTAIWIRGMAYEQKGDLKAAIHDYQEALKKAPGEPNYLAALGHAYALAKRTSEAKKILDELQKESKEMPVSPFFVALVYTGLDDKDMAFEWLEKAYQQRSGSIRYLKVEPRLDSLRSDARYEELMKRAGLAQ